MDCSHFIFLFAFFLCQFSVRSTNITSFTVHILHDATDPDSIDALGKLHVKFCSEFACVECADGQLSCAVDSSVALTTSNKQLFRLPLDIAQPALSWLMQFRTARVNSASIDLDIAVHPDTDLGPDQDYLQYKIWGGRNHPADTNKIYADNVYSYRSSAQQAQDDDNLWAYTCSSDATGEDHFVDLCSSPPWAPGTTCRAGMLGAHLHLYYQQNSASSVAAKDKFKELATEQFGLDPALCPDDNGHEQPHETTCWLSGPGGHEAEYPQNGSGGSFTTGKISIYITNEDFSSVLAWILANTGEETLGQSLDFIIHPCFGCNFADHQLWSLHRGTSVPNNMFGIANSGGWKGDSPPSVDPLGPPADLCGPFDVFTYSVHLVSDPTSLDALDHIFIFRFITSFLGSFPEGLTLPYDEPMDYTQSDNIFLADEVLFLAAPEILANIISWLPTAMPTAMPTENPMFSIFIHPNSLWAPFENRCDMNEHGLWLGEKFPMKNNFTSPTLTLDQMPSFSSPRQQTQNNFILYIYTAPNNPWQISAWNKFLDMFAEATNLERNECVDLYPGLEPAYDRLCMMQEVEKPYMDKEEVMTTTYAGIFIPADDFSRVLNIVQKLEGPSVLGYSVDLQLIQLNGSPALDFSNVRSFSSGQRWFLNHDVLSL